MTWYRQDFGIRKNLEDGTHEHRWDVEETTSIDDAHRVVAKWLSMGGGHIIHEESQLIIYMGFYTTDLDYEGRVYFTVWEQR